MILCAILAAMLAAGCGEDKPEKESWYWMHDCYQDHIPFRSWKEGGFWKYEIADNINEDILLTYMVIYGDSSREESVAIKTGLTTGVLSTDIPDSENMDLEVVSVIAMKSGVPYKSIECEFE